MGVLQMQVFSSVLHMQVFSGSTPASWSLDLPVIQRASWSLDLPIIQRDETNRA